jgi:integrase
MPRLKITDSAVARLKAEKTTWYSDRQFSGLQVAVGPSSKTYYATGRVNGSPAVLRIKLGKHPFMTATAARRAAVAALTAMADGYDPRRPGFGPSPTLGALLEDYITYRSARGRLTSATAAQYRAIAKTHCGKWLEREAAKITKADMRALHDRLRKKPYMANQLLRVLRSVFKHAIDRLDVDMRDPTRGIDAYPAHARTGIEDLAGWYGEVGRLPNLVRRHFMLIGALTGIRRRNLASLEWAHVDLGKKTLRLPRTKSGTTPTLPLSDLAVELLRGLEGLDARWVFPAASKSGHLEEPRADTVRGNIHQLRHMFTDAGAACSIPKYVLKKLRGDVTREEAIDGYVHEIVSHEAVNKIAEHLQKRWSA